MVSVFLSLLFVSGAAVTCPNKGHINVHAPRSMEALSGSCLRIPCSFTSAETLEFKAGTFGVWIKKDSRFASFPNNVIFNGSSPVNTYQLEITGELREKNCTTVIYNLTRSHSDSYFFRIESEAFKATAACDPLQINVKDSAPSPSIEKSGGDLKEQESLTLTCSAPTPCPHSPPKLTWLDPQGPRLEENSDGTFTTKLRQIITLSDEHDGYNITCSASYPVSGGTVEAAPAVLTLSVSYAPKDTLASSASAGGRVILTCSSRANPPVSHFAWFKKSSDGAANVSAGVVYNVSAADGGVYFCQATNDLGSEKSAEIRLTDKGEPLRWEVLLGGIVGIVLVVCSVVLVWRLRSTRPTAQQTQSLTGQDLAAKESASKTGEENIQYGQINFSKVGAEPSRDLQQQPDTVYAQVKVSHRANSSTQAADEDLYAQVK